jgi:hypothetical protein
MTTKYKEAKKSRQMAVVRFLIAICHHCALFHQSTVTLQKTETKSHKAKWKKIAFLFRILISLIAA